jgi:hypothetical protein
VVLILAGKQDEAARSLAARWSRDSAALLSPEDLSISGWRHHTHNAIEDIAVINGQPMEVRKLTGVLIRLPCVSEHELINIVPPDRAYVASEMTAFLLSWLVRLECPLLNRPTPSCLSGPGWRTEQWVNLAARLGIPVCPVRRHARPQDEVSTAPLQHAHNTVTVVGSRCFGDCGAIQTVQAKRLAATAGVDLLAVHFVSVGGEPKLFSADLWPDVTSAEVADAILEYFHSRYAC